MASSPPLRVLVVDDEKNIRSTLQVCLEAAGATVTAVESSEAAMTAARREAFDLAFVDLRLAEDSGLDLTPRLMAQQPALSIVVVTAYATIDSAVEAMRRGARDYLPKPFTPAQIRHVVEAERERRRLTSRVVELESRLIETAPDIDLESDAPGMRVVIETIAQAAGSEASVLLRGESGTGKGVLARELHRWSPRRDRPFVTMSCPTLSRDLVASELFGHARGAFTGAVRDQPGRVEAAAGGTLFLDEVGELDPGLQAKLLRFLQDKEFERVGENLTRRADVRIVAATNRDLAADIATGRFREDLFYRLNVIEVVVPPLRERPQDIPRLAERFLEFFARAARRPAMELSEEARELLLRYAWPGNVRELRNVIERLSILWREQRVTPAALPERMRPSESPRPRLGGDFTIDDIEREHILEVLGRAHSQEEAARILGIDASTLWRKRKRDSDLAGDPGEGG